MDWAWASDGIYTAESNEREHWTIKSIRGMRYCGYTRSDMAEVLFKAPMLPMKLVQNGE